MTNYEECFNLTRSFEIDDKITKNIFYVTRMPVYGNDSVLIITSNEKVDINGNINFKYINCYRLPSSFRTTHSIKLNLYELSHNSLEEIEKKIEELNIFLQIVNN
mgnify:CR=1 FL=1